MPVIKKGIPPEDFYGRKTARQEKIEALLKKKPLDKPPPKVQFRLLGLSTTWEVFKKQQDALDFCLKRRKGTMAFAFEDINARRMFLVAHPKTFWSLNSERFFKTCNTYEIIQEHTACKLYLDIEYEYNYNPDRNGNLMLKNLLTVINFNLKSFFNINCSEDDILDLDSSSNLKFSHHVIYEIKNVAFQDNYALGNFIKMICGELREAFENKSSEDATKLKELCKKYSLSERDILELFVQDRKGQTKLLLDEGVYTKNRHFRLLGSSKQTKSIPLTISEHNKYKPHDTSDSKNCCFFLDSLITNFSWQVERVLEFGENPLKKQKIRPAMKVEKASEVEESTIHPQIDRFINTLISPFGMIRRKVFFNNSSVIVYDIQGFRYCDNIKRHHKSNNIKYVIDLQCLGYYQKCYDPDCADFRSDMKQLPDEIRFLFEDDELFMNQGSAEFEESVEEVFTKAVEEIENCSFEETISDHDLENVVACTEAMLEINW